ncbi:MAG: hypothetical protein K0B10_07175 [Vicingaceae bacterium]|nr:hypothetical protein [Vicingaceae bacterium]
MAFKGNFTKKDLQKAFLAGQEESKDYKGNNVFVTTKRFTSFDEWYKQEVLAKQIKEEEEESEQ